MAGTRQIERSAIRIEPGQDVELELRFEEAALVTGRVVGPDGEPIEGAQVEIAVAAEGTSANAGGLSDFDGHFVARLQMAPGRATIVARYPGLLDAVLDTELEPGNNDVLLELGRGLEIRGTVVDDSGRPVSGAVVKWWLVDPRHSLFSARPTMPGTDELGRFVVSGLREGTYQIAAHAPGLAQARLDEPLELGDSSISGVELMLGPGGAIGGRILGLEVDDLSLVRVTADLLGQGLIGPDGEAPVDFEGRYRLDDMAFGDWQVTATLRRGQEIERSLRQVVSISPEGASVELDFDFDVGLTLVGRMTRGGEPLSGALLILSSEASQGSVRSRTDHLGAFHVEGLERGRYSLYIAATDGVSAPDARS